MSSPSLTVLGTHRRRAATNLRAWRERRRRPRKAAPGVANWT
ncbi:hypothetical protein [Kocuria atrinae]|nr:hypothetical protein [Kocuria atrinae]